jgi:hypothetical protein
MELAHYQLAKKGLKVGTIPGLGLLPVVNQSGER